jgi:hypothetical protein
MERRDFLRRGAILSALPLAGRPQLAGRAWADSALTLNVTVDGSPEFTWQVRAALALIEQERWGRYFQLHVKRIVEEPPPISRSWPGATGEVVRDGDGRGTVYWKPGYVQTLPVPVLAMLLIHEAEHVSQQNEQGDLGVATKGALAEFGADRVAHAFGIQLGLTNLIVRDVRRIQDDPRSLQVPGSPERHTFLVWDGPMVPGDPL